MNMDMDMLLDGDIPCGNNRMMPKKRIPARPPHGGSILGSVPMPTGFGLVLR